MSERKGCAGQADYLVLVTDEFETASRYNDEKPVWLDKLHGPYHMPDPEDEAKATYYIYTHDKVTVLGPQEPNNI